MYSSSMHPSKHEAPTARACVRAGPLSRTPLRASRLDGASSEAKPCRTWDCSWSGNQSVWNCASDAKTGPSPNDADLSLYIYIYIHTDVCMYVCMYVCSYTLISNIIIKSNRIYYNIYNII